MRSHRTGEKTTGTRGASWEARALPSPGGGGTAARESAAAGRWFQKKLSSGLASSPSRTRREGGKPGVQGKGRRRGRGGAGQGCHHPSRRAERPVAPFGGLSRAPGGGLDRGGKERSPLRFESQKYGDVKNTRDVSCTLCIGPAGPRRSALPRGVAGTDPLLEEEAGRGAGPRASPGPQGPSLPASRPLLQRLLRGRRQFLRAALPGPTGRSPPSVGAPRGGALPPSAPARGSGLGRRGGGGARGLCKL